MADKPILIAQTIDFIYRGIVKMEATPPYTPPKDGYVLNDEDEWNATLWDESICTKPLWSDIVLHNDEGYPWARWQDIFENWPAIKAKVLSQ